jgi:pimeloyl-ACP methyl ester carboxylesterase
MQYKPAKILRMDKAGHPMDFPRSDRMTAELSATADYAQQTAEIAWHNLRTFQEAAGGFAAQWADFLQAGLTLPAADGDLPAYLTDAFQRGILFTDILRRRGNNFLAIEKAGPESMLAYDHEVILSGRDLPRPSNYSLVKIRPEPGVVVHDDTRPYVIIDPRAGHGSGIGGFKSESEVGVAIRAGHPVYFVIFSQHPVPGQTLADVCSCEAEFIREVRRRHPHSPKPVVVGNCQGGWASMLLAATNPDLTGPVVANGAPLSYWSGVRGKNPMRYTGGIAGGITPALMLADLGNGEFDGANLVLNFEALNPGNTWWKKYYDVFAKTDQVAPEFLRFEQWWSAFYFMTGEEIRWIVENLFIGNRFARGGVYLDSGMHADLRNIRAPIVLFASHGDNITPVPQAVSWIADVYKNVREIQAHGQRIVYTVHDSVGHLGIFVSSSVAKKEHQEIGSTLKVIEALAPGLYEMKIIDVTGEGHARRYAVDFEERQIKDLAAFDDDRHDEAPFAAVAKLSELVEAGYRLFARPWMQAIGNEAMARLIRDANPVRLRRTLTSDLNPLVAAAAVPAEQVRADRKPADPDNPYLALEHKAAALVEGAWNLFRTWRDGMVESLFYTLYTSPAARALAEGGRKRISDGAPEDLRTINDVSKALESAALGGYPNGLVRILILLARSRRSVRRDRLERSNEVLSSREPFNHLSEVVKNRIIRQQSLIIEFEPELALATLPKLLPSPADRMMALEQAAYVLGPEEEMSDTTREMLDSIRGVLGVLIDTRLKAVTRDSELRTD